MRVSIWTRREELIEVRQRSLDAHAGQELTQQAADPVAARRTPSGLGGGVWNRERASASGSTVMRSASSAQACSIAMSRHGFLGVQEGHGREVQVGLCLTATRAENQRFLEHTGGERAPTPCMAVRTMRRSRARRRHGRLTALQQRIHVAPSTSLDQISFMGTWSAGGVMAATSRHRRARTIWTPCPSRPVTTCHPGRPCSRCRVRGCARP